MPHGMCYAWKPEILWLHVFSDAAIAIAYFMIPIAIFYFTRLRRDMPFRGLLLMFTVFILACGLTHAFSIWTVWQGDYGTQGILKFITAIASIGTAVMLIPVTPKLLAMRSPQELAEANSALKVEMQNRQTHEAESQRLQQELAHAGRISTMGQMASGLAHELNQPLTTITQNADSVTILAERGATGDPMVLRLVKHIATEAHRAGDIIKALRGLVSKSDLERAPVDMEALVDQVVQLSVSEARDGNVALKVGCNVNQKVLGNRAQLGQVLVNLIRNAIESIVLNDSATREVVVTAKDEANGILVSVADTGAGFDKDLKLLEPFETTKSQGMGMGLYICNSIIESHKGTFDLRSNEGGGAVVTFKLPANKLKR